MSETDLLFKIIAQDEYQGEMAAARAAVEKMTDEERQAVKVQHELEKAEAEAMEQLRKVEAAEEAAAEAAREQAEANKQNALSFTELNQALELGQKALATFKQAFDFAKEGASITRIENQFDSAADAFGESGDKLIRKIDDVTGRTIDDEGAMAVAARTMTQGIVQSGNQIVQMFEIARASSVRFGGDTTGAYQALSNAVEFGNARVLRSVVGVVDFDQAYQDLAESLGKTTKQLTDQEMQQARLNAVLSAGKRLVDDVGDAVNDDVSKMERLERATGDLGDMLKTTFAEIAVPVFEQATVTLEALNGTLQSDIASVYGDHVDEMTQRLAEGDETAASFREEIERTAIVVGKATPVYDDWGNIIRYDVTPEVEAQIDAQILLANAIRDSTGETSEGEKFLRIYAGSVEETTQTVEQLKEAEERTKAAVADLNTIIGGAVGKEMEQYKGKQEQNRAKAAELQKELDKLMATHGRAVTTQKKATLSANELNLANLQLAEAQKKLAAETDPLKQAQLAVQVDKLAGKVNEANGAMSGATTSYVDNSKKIDEIRGKLGELDSSYAANASAHEEATARIVFGYLQQKAMVDGVITDTELTALTEAGKALKIYDQATADALASAGATWDAFVKSGDVQQFTKDVYDAKAALLGLPTYHQFMLQLSVTGREDVASALAEVGVSRGDVYDRTGGKAGRTPARPSAPRRRRNEQQDFAAGGVVEPIWVGEHGREPFFPAVGGRVVSHREAMNALSQNDNSVNIAPGAIVIQAAPGMDASAIAEEVERRIAQKSRRYRAAGVGSLGA